MNPRKPPPRATVMAISATPSAIVSAASSCVAPRYALISPTVPPGHVRCQARLQKWNAFSTAPASCGLLSRCDHDPAGRVLEDVVHRLAEDVAVAAAGGAEDDDLGLAPLGLLDDRAAGIAGPDDAVDHPHTVGLRRRASLVEQPVGLGDRKSTV